MTFVVIGALRVNLKIAACDPSEYIMDHRNFNISSRMEESKKR